jgi:cyclopropane fatty-acyl-phospholipid synthase-like methyltransferase
MSFSPPKSYIPALRYEWLTTLYDPLIRWGLREETFKHALIRNAHLEKVRRVLDIGCGTGTLMLRIKAIYPYTDVVGLDGDRKILSIAKTKAARARLRVQLDYGLAQQLPYMDNSFDRVVSSLMLHHLTHADKQQTLTEVFRVLKPGGEMHIVDWTKPHTPLMAATFLLVRSLDGFETTADNAQGRLPALITEAGFPTVHTIARWSTALGTLGLFSAQKPVS